MFGLSALFCSGLFRWWMLSSMLLYVLIIRGIRKVINGSLTWILTCLIVSVHSYACHEVNIRSVFHFKHNFWRVCVFMVRMISLLISQRHTFYSLNILLYYYCIVMWYTHVSFMHQHICIIPCSLCTILALQTFRNSLITLFTLSLVCLSTNSVHQCTGEYYTIFLYCHEHLNVIHTFILGRK